MKSRRILLCLSIAGTLFTAGASEHAVLDSMKGRAEVQRAGSVTWKACGTGTKLYNNDMIRVGKQSTARVLMPDNSTVYIHPESQILVNLYRPEHRGRTSKHLTVFAGAIFFLVKSALPDALAGRDDSKVFTPTTVIATRGTSFEVGVTEESGTTNVRVLNGTVLVRNILKDASRFLSAGYHTTVKMNTDPIVPGALLDKHIKALKAWVPPPVIDHEMKEQVKKARRDHRVITGKLKNRLVVAPLVNRSEYEGAWEVGRAMAEMLASQLEHEVRGLEVDVPDSTAGDPLELGERSGARFVVTGSVEKLQVSQEARISAAADTYEEYDVAGVEIFLRLIDVARGKQVLEDYFTTEESEKRRKENTWKAMAKMQFSMEDKAFSASLVGKAVDQVSQRSSAELVRYLRPLMESARARADSTVTGDKHRRESE